VDADEAEIAVHGPLLVVHAGAEQLAGPLLGAPLAAWVAQLAALGAAVLIALELCVNHWFYLYIVWFAPLVFVALFLAYDRITEEDEPEWDEEPAAREVRPSAPAAAAAQ
jgi:fatty acid desaturase